MCVVPRLPPEYHFTSKVNVITDGEEILIKGYTMKEHLRTESFAYASIGDSYEVLMAAYKLYHESRQSTNSAYKLAIPGGRYSQKRKPLYLNEMLNTWPSFELRNRIERLHLLVEDGHGLMVQTGEYIIDWKAAAAKHGSRSGSLILNAGNMLLQTGTIAEFAPELIWLCIHGEEWKDAYDAMKAHLDPIRLRVHVGALVSRD